MINIRKYLTRIRYSGETRPTLGVLQALQESHLMSVPFENLDIHAGREIALDPDFLFRKIVVMKRGGFCYELNGLFHLLLTALGFQVILAMGRVYDRQRGVYGPEFDHALVLAGIDGETWLADVGFGDFSMFPLPFTLNQPIPDRNGRFLIEEENAEYFRVSRFTPEEQRYIPEYLFSPKPRCLSDFSSMCVYHQTSPDSHFTKHKICSMATASGRTTLLDDRLIVTEGGNRTESPIRSRSEFEYALARHFGIIQYHYRGGREIS